jgi:metal-responsive CopG/Arc/MetJ family transcriptional regulator
MAKKKAAKMGRPVSPDGPAVVVAVSLPRNLADALDAYVEAQGVSKSAAVADALRVWLKRRRA